MRRTIIFLPGFKGSKLISKTGELVWPNFWHAQWDNTTSLHLSLPEIKLYNNEHYIAQDIVDAVTILPWIYRYSIYGKWIRFLSESFSKNTKILYYPYDWRQDLSVLSEQLSTFIRHLIEKGKDNIVLIGHSMGGLIISGALRRLNHPAVRKAFFVSTPFEGSLKALLYLMHGNAFGFNTMLLSKKAMATFPSVYYLLPRYAQAVKHEAFLSFETLKKYSLGFLMQSSTGQEYVKHVMECRASFYGELAKLTQYQPDTTFIFIHNRTVNTPFSLTLGETCEVEQGFGDGTVPTCSLAVPAYFDTHETKQHDITQSHTTSFSDEKLFALMSKYLK